MSTLVIDSIGVLVTNDEALGDGPLGTRRDVALVLDEQDGVLAIEPPGAIAD